MGKTALYIYSAPRGTGKTSDLFNWSLTVPEMTGVLMPDYQGERHWLLLPERKSITAMAREGEAFEKTGKYIFSQDTLRQVNVHLIRMADQPGSAWFVMDELGPLELNGMGLFPALAHICSKKIWSHKNTLLVVRERLLNEFILQFGLQEGRRVGRDDLASIFTPLPA